MSEDSLSAGQAGVWILIPDYDHLSYEGRYSCAVCGASETPKPVFRPPVMIDMDGFFDICPDCIGQAAHQLGFVTEAANGVLMDQIDQVTDQYGEALVDLASSREAQASLARENVRLQDQIEELEQAFEVPDGFIIDDDYDDVS